MLKILRHKNVSKMVLWGILILILPAFVIWGAGEVGNDSDRPKSVGTIDGKKVSFDDFAGSVSSVRCQIFLSYFNNDKVLRELVSNQSLIGKIAWDRLIMLKEARRLKVRADNSEVIAYIRNHPLFLRNGTFDDQLYNYILRNNLSLDPRTFEEVVRENIAMQKMNSELTKDIVLTDEELAAYYKANNCRFRIAYVLLAEGDATEGAEDKYNKMMEAAAKDGKGFEAAAAEAGLQLQELPAFSRTDYLEGLGEAMPIAAVAAGMSRDGVSAPVMTRRGVIAFKLLDVEGFDQAKFNADKPEYSTKLLELKKNLALEMWLKGLEEANTLNIDLNEYEKYYRP